MQCHIQLSSPTLLLGQIMEGSGDCGEIKDELLVEVAEPNEQLYSFHRAGGFPFLNDSKFDWVHSNMSLLDDHTQVFCLCLIEEALF